MNRLNLEYDDFRISDLAILHDLSAPQFDIVEALSRHRAVRSSSSSARLTRRFSLSGTRQQQESGKAVSHGLSGTPWRSVRNIKRYIDNLTKGNAAVLPGAGILDTRDPLKSP